MLGFHTHSKCKVDNYVRERTKEERKVVSKKSNMDVSNGMYSRGIVCMWKRFNK